MKKPVSKAKASPKPAQSHVQVRACLQECQTGPGRARPGFAEAHDRAGKGRADALRLAGEGAEAGGRTRATSIWPRPRRPSRAVAASARWAAPATPAAAGTPREMAELTNAIQKFFLENSRLGIPVIFHEECLHGHAAPAGTSFLAAHRPRRHLQSRTGGAALHHDGRRGPRCAERIRRLRRWWTWRASRAGAAWKRHTAKIRFLVSRLGIAAVRGFQGDRRLSATSSHVIATLKHLSATGSPSRA